MNTFLDERDMPTVDQYKAGHSFYQENDLNKYSEHPRLLFDS